MIAQPVLVDENGQDPPDTLVRENNFKYVSMEGNIACLVNNADLAMATMDIIRHYGGNPAGYLDVGDSVNQASVENAFGLLMSDAKVKVVLVNIIGDIVNCETIARAVIAVKSKVNVPLVVRVEGTNAEQARILLVTTPDIIAAPDLDDAVQMAVKLAL